MKRISILLALLSGLALSAHAAEFPTAPDWTLQNAAGEAVSLDSISQQRPVVLFFWATWCPYCKALMPHLQSISYQHGDSVEIVSIQVFDDGDAAAYLADNGYDFSLLLNGDEVAEMYGVSGTPGVLLIDMQKRIRFDRNKAPRLELPFDEEEAGHRKKAAHRAPFWAAQLRSSLEDVLAEQN